MPQHLRSRDGSKSQWDVMMMHSDDLRKPMTPDQLNLLAECTALTKGLHRRAYEIDKSFDVVITSLGFSYDNSAFSAGNITVQLRGGAGSKGGPRSRKAPNLRATHESASTKHLFFVGANSHGLDRVRYQSSGGAIIGFRYTTRAVFRTLESTYEDGKSRAGMQVHRWPKVQPLAAKQFKDLLKVKLWKQLLERIMFSAPMGGLSGGAMVDGIIFVERLKRCIYIEEVPEDTLHGLFPGSARISWGFYAGGAAPLHDMFTSVRFTEQAPVAHPFHPVIEYWPAGTPSPKDMPVDQEAEAAKRQSGTHPSSVWPSTRKTSRFHFKADRLTDFTNSAQVPQLDLFLRDVEQAVAGGAGGGKGGGGEGGDGGGGGGGGGVGDVLEHSFHELYDTLNGRRS